MEHVFVELTNTLQGLCTHHVCRVLSCREIFQLPPVAQWQQVRAAGAESSDTGAAGPRLAAPLEA